MNQDKFKEKKIERLVVDSTGEDSTLRNLTDTSVPTDVFLPEEKFLSPGTVIAGHYEVLSIIGQGAMGTVYKTRHLLVDQIRAVKILRMRNESQILRRFQQEAKASLALEHPNIVRVFEFGIDSQMQQPFLVMEFVEGETLNTVLAKRETLTCDDVSEIIEQVCKALAHAHANGIVHRDIKPGNIILTKDSTGADVAKLVDFGIAKIKTPEDGQDLTQTGEVFGTPLYMSPEQCLGRKVDSRSDIYSLGCVMYECLVGKPPFQGASSLETIMMHVNNEPTIPKLARKAEPVILSALEKAPSDRYQSMQEMQSAIKMLKSTAAPYTVASPSRKRKRFVWLVSGTSMAFVALGIWCLELLRRQTQNPIFFQLEFIVGPVILLIAVLAISWLKTSTFTIKSFHRHLRTKSNRLLAVFLLTVLTVGAYTIAYFGLNAKVFWDRREVQRLKAELIAEKRNDPIAWLGIAHELEQKGDLVDAERAFRQSIQLKPDYKPAWLGLADILKKQGRTKDAEEALKRANELKADHM